MKISISNIAWDKKDDEEVYEILKRYKFYGLDVAPARVFDDPMGVSEEEGKKFIEKIGHYGLTPVGMQSLLFGTDGLALFETGETQEATIQHLKKMMDYAAKIGVTRLVFGSPKNRLIGDRGILEVEEACHNIFNELGDYAIERNMYFCIEPNPKNYGADFVTNTLEGVELVKQINNPGFRLHLDLGTMIMNEESIEKVVQEAVSVTEHVHLSHPNLDQVIGMEDIHRKLKKALHDNNYNGVIAIEMKNSMLPDNVERVRQTVEFISKMYGGN